MRTRPAALRLLLSAGLLYALFRFLDVKETARLFLNARPSWILAALLWILLSMAVSVEKWVVLLRGQGLALSWKAAWKAYWAGLFLNNFLPSSIGGDAFRAYSAGKAAGSVPGVLLSVVFERTLALSALALMGLTAAVCLPHCRAYAVSFSCLALGGIAAAWLVTRGAALARPGREIGNRFLRSLAEKLAPAAEYAIRLSRSHPAWIRSFSWSLVFQGTVVMVYLCTFRAVGANLGWLEAFLVVPAISALSMLPVSINGFGLREGAAVALLAPWGIQGEAAASASLLFGLMVSLASLYGGFLLAIGRTSGKEECA